MHKCLQTGLPCSLYSLLSLSLCLLLLLLLGLVQTLEEALDAIVRPHNMSTYTLSVTWAAYYMLTRIVFAH